jgi:hypothetical protein
MTTIIVVQYEVDVKTHVRVSGVDYLSAMPFSDVGSYRLVNDDQWKRQAWLVF